VSSGKETGELNPALLSRRAKLLGRANMYFSKVMRWIEGAYGSSAEAVQLTTILSPATASAGVLRMRLATKGAKQLRRLSEICVSFDILAEKDAA